MLIYKHLLIAFVICHLQKNINNICFLTSLVQEVQTAKVFENKLIFDLNDNTSLNFYLCSKPKKR